MITIYNGRISWTPTVFHRERDLSYMSTPLIHPTQKKRDPLKACCKFISHDLEWTNLGPLKLIPMSNQLEIITYGLHTI